MQGVGFFCLLTAAFLCCWLINITLKKQKIRAFEVVFLLFISLFLSDYRLRLLPEIELNAASVCITLYLLLHTIIAWENTAKAYVFWKTLLYASLAPALAAGVIGIKNYFVIGYGYVSLNGTGILELKIILLIMAVISFGLRKQKNRIKA